MTSSESWQPPCWSQIPPSTQQWHLDELKNGILLGTHSLNTLLSTNRRRCITFGRIDDPTQIDILTAHESCSRLHARIAFTSSGGIPYLKDLGSGNGTFVNNRQLPPEACGKWECTDENNKEKEVRGSRGVVLYPGDAIRFGCSTRIFVLEGPEEFERGASHEKPRRVVSGVINDAAVVRDANVNQDGAVVKNDDDDVEEICTWGMSTTDDYNDDEQQDEQLQQQSSSASAASQTNSKSISNSNTNNLPSIDTFFSSTSTNYTISNTLQQLYNQYQSKSYKFNTISTESKRISQKQDNNVMGVELTDGQRNQLAKNRDKLTALEASLRGLKEKIEEGMCLAIHGKGLNHGHSQGRRRDDGYHGQDGEDEDDVDDFFDRTATTLKRQRNNDHEDEQVESESSLIQKWKMLIQSYSKQQIVIASKTRQCNNLQHQINNSSSAAGEDEEDAFFLQNDLNLVMEDVKKATRRLEDMESDLKGVERLLKIVNPKLSWDRELGVIGTDLHVDTVKAKSRELEADNATADVANEQDESIMMMPPPPQKAGISTSANSFDMPPPPVMSTTAAAKRPISSSDMMPPPPPKATMGATESTSLNVDEKKDINEHPINPDRATPQEKGEQSPSPPKKKRQLLGPMRPPPPTTNAAGTQGGTLAALKQFNEASSNNNSHDHARKKQKKSNNSATAAVVFDSRKDEWNAPTDQDGSGRTSLHDKFKGRY
mmetsp:Transcript_16034/g.24948  ORF Transcript_16034/g.24948 Transcript_16034/m.24948 type:complete len:715 (-) Transcript_16034:1160-3304(-)